MNDRYFKELNGYLVKDEMARNDITNINNRITNITTPEAYGAIGDGETDDTTALKNAFLNGRFIIFDKNKTYLVTEPIICYDGTIVDMNGSTITGGEEDRRYFLFRNFLPTDNYLEYNGNGNIIVQNGTFEKGTIELIHGENIKFENVKFLNSTSNHFIELCACKNTIFRDCSFKGMIRGAGSYKEYLNIDNCKNSNFPYLNDGDTFDDTIVDGLLVDNCVFDINNTTLRVAVGKHSYSDSEDYYNNPAKNITIRNTKVIGATDSAFHFVNAENVNIENCYTEECSRTYALEYCKNCKINNNNIIQSISNYLKNCININIISNIIEKTSDTSDIILYDGCDDINYSYNTINNEIGFRLPINFDSNTDIAITNLNCIGNNYITIPNETSNVARGCITYPPTTSTITFKNVDDAVFRGLSNSKSVSNNSYSLTNFNQLILQLGNMNSDTFQEIKVKSFTGRNFIVGEVYKIPIIDYDGTLNIETITITDEHTITTTLLNIRTAFALKLPRG